MVVWDSGDVVEAVGVANRARHREAARPRAYRPARLALCVESASELSAERSHSLLFALAVLQPVGLREELVAALVDEEATAAASLLVLASAAALCLASLSLAVLALGVARRRAREREELAAFKANYAPMLSENEQA